MSDLTRTRSRFRLAHKFALIGLLAFAPLVAATFLLHSSLEEGIAFARQELAGSRYQARLRAVMEPLQTHRGASSAVRRGEAGFEAVQAQARRSVDEALSALAATDAELGSRLATGERARQLAGYWDAIKALPATAPAEESFRLHSEAVGEVVAFMDHVSNTSQLALDPDVDSYYTITLYTVALPRLAEKAGQMRAAAVRAAVAGRLSPQERYALGLAAGAARGLREGAESAVQQGGAANSVLREAIDPRARGLWAALDAFGGLVDREIVSVSAIGVPPARVFESGTAAVSAAWQLFDVALPAGDQLLEARIARLENRNWTIVASVSAAALLAVICATVVMLRTVVRPLRGGVALAGAIAGGRLDNAVVARGSDEIAQLVSALGRMQDELRARLQAERTIAQEALRVKSALDCGNTPVRIADADGTIVYVNDAMRSALRRIEAELARRVPGFRADSVVGSSVGVFHEDPAAVVERLKALRSTARLEMRMGGRDFLVSTTPIVDASGAVVGSVGEWLDLTEQKAAEREVAEVVSAAMIGDFGRRIPVAGKDGFLLQLATDVNRLVTQAELGLGEVGRALKALAQGDLTQRVEGEFEGQFAALQSDSNASSERLHEFIGQIRMTAEAITTASKEIAAGNSNLSQRTEEQASSLEETASSMEELTSTVKQNAENAKQANQLAIGASEVAVKGGEVVAEVVTTMQAINESAGKIVDIISVIDGIAFQTNILALNAAVEAARAGEQGRGFAVVATEVRNLAQRSAAAAKEIKVLISDSASKVESGSRLVDRAGATMQEIVGSVRRVTDIMSEITAASVEQSSGIEQVNQAVTQMDEVTQQNAALVEQAAAAAESLEEQAQALSQACAVFRLGGGGASDAEQPEAAGLVGRRGPDRARNVERLAVKRRAVKVPQAQPAATAPTGSDDWESF
jgi:methyl-accepting chemotaxis protein